MKQDIDTANSMYILSVVSMTSVSTMSGVVAFFAMSAIVPLIKRSCCRSCKKVCPRSWRKSSRSMLLSSSSSPYEYYRDSSRTNKSGQTGDNDKEDSSSGDDNEEEDIDQIVFQASGDEQVSKMGLVEFRVDVKESVVPSSSKLAVGERNVNERNVDERNVDERNERSDAQSVVNKRIFTGDILTVTMVWTNVYGLGLACFCMSYIITMASTLASFSFMAGTSSICVYELVQERWNPMKDQWRLGRPESKLRSALHIMALLIGIIGMSLLGHHITSIRMNTVGNIRGEDALFGIVAPILTPLLLKAVRRPHTTIIGTVEVALPFACCICLVFLVASISGASGHLPSDISQQGRNIAVSATILPAVWGCSLMYMLHCIFRKRMIYVFCSFLLVFAGRELTMHRKEAAVLGSFVLCLISFSFCVIASFKKVLLAAAPGGGGGI